MWSAGVQAWALPAVPKLAGALCYQTFHCGADSQDNENGESDLDNKAFFLPF